MQHTKTRPSLPTANPEPARPQVQYRRGHAPHRASAPSPAHPPAPHNGTAGIFATGTSKHTAPIGLLASELRLGLQMLENMLLPREAF